MRDHPDIERAERWGYPRKEPKPMTGNATIVLRLGLEVEPDDECRDMDAIQALAEGHLAASGLKAFDIHSIEVEDLDPHE